MFKTNEDFTVHIATYMFLLAFIVYDCTYIVYSNDKLKDLQTSQIRTYKQKTTMYKTWKSWTRPKKRRTLIIFTWYV